MPAEAPDTPLGAVSVEDQQALAAALAETSQSLVCIFDRDGRILGFNQICEQATGFTAAEVSDATRASSSSRPSRSRCSTSSSARYGRPGSPTRSSGSG